MFLFALLGAVPIRCPWCRVSSTSFPWSVAGCCPPHCLMTLAWIQSGWWITASNTGLAGNWLSHGTVRVGRGRQHLRWASRFGGWMQQHCLNGSAWFRRWQRRLNWTCWFGRRTQCPNWTNRLDRRGQHLWWLRWLERCRWQRCHQLGRRVAGYGLCKFLLATVRCPVDVVIHNFQCPWQVAGVVGRAGTSQGDSPQTVQLFLLIQDTAACYSPISLRCYHSLILTIYAMQENHKETFVGNKHQPQHKAIIGSLTTLW